MKKCEYAESPLNAKTNVGLHPSEITLTGEQLQLLKEFLLKYKKANSQGKTKIIGLAVNAIESRYAEDTKFDREALETVRANSTAIFRSYIF